MATIKVLIAVRSEGFARAIQHVLNGEAGISSVAVADSRQGLTEQVQLLRPSLIIVNSRWLGSEGSAALTQLKRTDPRPKVIQTCSLEEFGTSIAPEVVDACVLEETLVPELPSIVRRLASRPRAMSSMAQLLTLGLALFLHAFAGSASARPTDTATHVPPNYYTLQPPPTGGTYVDPVFGATIKRISDSRTAPNAAMGTGATLPLISTEYSSMSPYNSDNSRILGLHFSYFGLYDGAGSFMKNLNVCASCEPRWSRNAPNVLYFISGNQLRRLDVSTDAVSVVHTFGEYASISGRGESDISVDGNHFVFAGDGRSIFVYEISTDTKGPVFDTGGRGFDSLYITPNNNVTITWFQAGTGRYNGIEMFDSSMSFRRQVTNAGGHMDVTSDTNGDEILLWTNSADPTAICPNAVVKVRLSDGHQTCLISLAWSLAIHVSGTDTGGWFFMETYDPVDTAPNSAAWKPYTNEILQVKLDGSEVRRLAHHRSRPFDSYNYTPRVSANRDGTSVVFSSNFGLHGPSTLYTDVYLMVLPASSPSSPSPALLPAPPPTSTPVSIPAGIRAVQVQTSAQGQSSVVRYEQTHAAVARSGEWANNNGAFNSGSSAMLSMDAGSRTTFTFVGTGVRWIGYRDEWSGVAKVYLDNALTATVDTFASAGAAQTVLYSVSGLSSGSHTLVLEPTGSRNAQSGGSWVWVDAFDVDSASSSGNADTSELQIGYGAINVGMGAAVLRTFVGQDLVSEAAVPASVAANEWTMYAEQAGNVSTGIAIANPNNMEAMVDLRLSDGRQTSLRIPAMGQRAAFVGEIFGDVQGSFLGTLKIRSNTPVAVLALRGTTNGGGQFIFTSIPLNSAMPEIGGTRVFPCVVDGSGYNSELILVNSSTTVSTGSVRFSFELATDRGTGRAFEFSIPAGEVWRIRTMGVSPGTVTSGYASLVMSGGSPMPDAVAILRLSSNGDLVSETAVPAQAPITRSMMFGSFGDNRRTGVAMANPLTHEVQVTLTAFDNNGGIVAPSRALTLGANSQTSAFLDDLIAGLPSGFEGYVVLDAPSSVYAISLRGTTNSRGGFIMSTLAIVDLDHLPSGAHYFPHVVNGGSFKTAFLMMSTGTSAPQLSLFSTDGKPMVMPVQ
jgi:hypothetical protein